MKLLPRLTNYLRVTFSNWTNDNDSCKPFCKTLIEPKLMSRLNQPRYIKFVEMEADRSSQLGAVCVRAKRGTRKQAGRIEQHFACRTYRRISRRYGKYLAG